MPVEPQEYQPASIREIAEKFFPQMEKFGFEFKKPFHLNDECFPLI